MADAKQGKSPTEDFYNGSSSQASRVVLAKPRLGSFGSSSFAASSSKGCNPFGSVLRPSQLKPGSNPFLKVPDTADEIDTEKEKEPEPLEDRLKDNKDDDEAPKFVPLGATNPTQRTSNPVPAPTQPATSTSSSGFVFGQNLSARVVMQENANNGEAAPLDHSSTNGTSLLFTSAAASVKDNSQDEASPGDAGGEGLAAAAAEYERSHARPPPPTTNYNITGEEDETNVLQISCRLFAWETGSWRERGRGVLRLNDAAGAAGASGAAGAGAARLVVRVAGSLRVALNTKLWPDMVVERAGAKSLRITAADAALQIKLYLIMGAPGDIVQLNRALSSRVAVMKRSAPAAAGAGGAAGATPAGANPRRGAERLEAAAGELVDKAIDDACNREEGFDHKPDDEYDPIATDRLDSPEKTDDLPAPVDSDDKAKPLKRKEPADDDMPPKRQCPDIVIE